MNEDTLLCIYAAVSVFILILAFVTGKKNKAYYDSLDKKQHPFRFLYPVSAVLYTVWKTMFRTRPDAGLISRIRRLYVKENVAEELFLHTLKKISLILTVLLATSLLGCLLCLSHKQERTVTSLERNQFGEGETVYELDVDYNGTRETLQIPVEEEKMTETEIRDLFEKYSIPVRKEMLGENSSADFVAKPLHLISSYEEVSIAWDIEDTDIVDYNGNISDSVEKDDRMLVNLYATFSLDGIAETYTMPVVITADTSDRRALLLKEIQDAVDKQNSIYDAEVTLPEQLDGNRISFSRTVAHNEYVFLVLAFLCVLLILFGYDRNLDREIRKRNEQMLLDFSEIVSKLSLLYEAGLSIYRAWERIVEDHEKKQEKEPHFAYQEMKMTLEKIRNGVSEREAYAQFGKRCGLHPYIKLGNLLEQNLTKGSKGLKLLLKQEVNDSFEERKRIARKKGEEAGTKLLFPMMIMLLIVIVIIAVPALLSMQL